MESYLVKLWGYSPPGCIPPKVFWLFFLEIFQSTYSKEHLQATKNILALRPSCLLKRNSFESLLNRA